MTSRVNMKFVVILGVSLVLVMSGVVFLMYKSVGKSGDEAARLGDEASAAGDFTKAAGFYSRAVNKDQRNADYIRKWIAAMEKLTPTPRQIYEDTYNNQYVLAMRSLCDADRRNPEPFRKFLDQRLELMQKSGGGLQTWEHFAVEYEDLMKKYAGDDAGKAKLRRYRGFARFGILVANPSASAEIVDGALEDLEAAIAADPEDGEAIIKASGIEMAKSKRARDRGDNAAAEQFQRSAAQRLEAFAKTDNPRAPLAAMELMRVRVSDEARNAKDPAAMMEVLRGHKGEITAILDKVNSTPSERTDTAAAALLASYCLFALPDGAALAREMLTHVKKGHPDDAMFLLVWARTDLTRGEIESATALAKEVSAMPDRPLSVQGRLLFQYRAEAVKTQADAAFAAWERAKDPAEREQLVKNVRQLRDDLAAKVGEGAPAILSTDARLALISGDTGGARTLITRYNDQTQRTDAQMLVLEGDLLTRTGAKGAAKQSFERALQLEKNNPRAALALAELAAAESDWKSAAQYFGLAKQLLPGNAQIAEQAQMMAELAAGGDIKDPVLKCIKRAQDQIFGVGADIASAATTLRECLRANPGDVRVTVALARVLVSLQKRDEALQVLNDALVKHPDERTLQQFKKSLDVQDPYTAAMAAIDQAANLSESQKELLRYDVCRRVSPPRTDEAKQHLDKARQLAPDSPEVLEVLFNNAAGSGDIAEVERIAAIAEQRNLDKVGGMLYRARKELAQAVKYEKDGSADRTKQKLSDASASLRSAIEKDKLCLPAWRMLGIIYADQGRNQEAVDALAKAVEIKPDDIASINAYIRALVAVGRAGDALAFARKAESYAAADSQFIEMMLTMESTVPGGSVDRAIALRQRLAANMDPTSPGMLANKQQLLSLLINADRFAEAKKVLDEITALNPDDPTTIELTAGLKGKSGDIAGAVKTYQDFINKTPDEKRTPMIFINASRLLLQLGQPDAALEVLDKGRQYQDAKTMVVDREIGDVLFNVGRMDAATQAYMRVIDAGGDDPGLAIRKRVLECYLVQKKLPEFEAFLAKIPTAQQDATVLLLAAEAAAAANDREKASRLYDQVITANPKSAIGYLKRADFNWNDPKKGRDVDADLEQVLRIEPNSVTARVKRALRARQLGHDDQAIQELKLAVATDPYNEQIRLALVQTYNELGRYKEAAEALEEAVQQSNGSLQWRARAAPARARLGEYDRAAEHWSYIWRERKAPDIAVAYADCLIRSGTPADISAAFNVLSAPELKSDNSLELRMIRARLMAKRGQTLDAATEVAAILASIDSNNRDQVGGFFNGLTAMYPKPAEQLAVLAKLESKSKFQGYMALQAATIRLRSEENKAQAVTALQDLAQNAQDSRLKAAAWAALGTLSYQDSKWEQARDQFQKGLDADADNAELNNNMAYVLGVKLNRGAEGLPFAQKAVSVGPANSGFHDTLGAVYIAMKDCQKAAAELAQALNYALNDGERLPVYIHIGAARLCLGDKVEARRNAKQARELMGANEALRRAFEDDLKELERKLDGQ